MASSIRELDPTQLGPEAERLQSDLKKRIIGQDEAMWPIVQLYQTYLAGLASPGRPVGNLLFLGPTGCGKTRMVEAVAESLAGNPLAVVKINCAEFQHSHEVAKLIGSPPGYLGHRETHPLLGQEMLDQFHTDKLKLSFVLFDEIEKASDALWKLLLGIMDKATLTLGDNRRVDFSHALIFMTSNLGATEMDTMIRPSLGFSDGEAERRQAAGSLDDSLYDKIARSAIGAARRCFSPEFINRIDKIAVFKPLGAAELRQILDLELGMVQERILTFAKCGGFLFQLTDRAKRELLAAGTDQRYGARHLKRVIEVSLVNPMSSLIATGQIQGGDIVKVDWRANLGKLDFVRIVEEMSAYGLQQKARIASR